MKWLIGVFVRRPITGTMVFLALTILGVFTFMRLKLDMFPDIEFPMVAVVTTYSGAGPESMEEVITRPIEDAMASVKKVEDVLSYSSQGVSLVLVRFAWGTDMEQAEQDVRKNLELFVEPFLPTDAERPISLAMDPSLQPIVFLAVNGPGGSAAVRKVAEDEIEPFLTRIPGVASAAVIGGAKREIQVRLRPDWLEAYKVSPQQIVGALRAANVMIPGGHIDQGAQELNLNTDALFDRVETIGEIVVGQRGGAPVRLKHVADVLDTFQERTEIVRADGVDAVMIAVRKQSDANTVQVARAVLDKLKSLQRQLPPGFTVTSLFDQADPITRSLSNLANSAYLAVLLTAAVLLAFLRSWRTSTIVLVSIPLSLLATFTVMDFGGVTLNLISMAGLALAVGMLVDNSIVVLENISTYVERGVERKQAAVQATLEMAMPITASTLTTVVVFAPVLFVPGIAGQIFKDMSLTICFSLLASLVIAITLVPMMASLIMGRGKGTRLERAVARLTFWLDPLADRYARLLDRALRRKKHIVGIAVGVFVLSLCLLPVVGVDFMPRTDQAHINFSVKAAPGTALAQTDRIFAQLEEVVREEVPEAKITVSQFGTGEGIGVLFGSSSSNSGTLQVSLPPRAQRKRSQMEIEDRLRERFKSIAGADIQVQQVHFGSGTGDVDVRVFCDDLQKLQEYGALLKAKLQTVEGVADVAFTMEQGKPELKIDLDREQIRLLGLNAAEVASTISTYFLGTEATTYREGGDEYTVLVRAPREVRENLDRLRSLPVVTPLGEVVPLQTVAHIRESLGPVQIARENKTRSGVVSVTAGGVDLRTLTAKVQGVLDSMDHVPGVSTSIEGAAEDMQDSFRGLAWALLVAVLLVYMVMASQFESLLEPFVILLAVPMAASGVIFALLVTGTTLQVTALIGMVLLSGVVVNNGIVLIDVLKRRRERGEELVQAAVEAGRSRLRPILMTTVTTVLGMTPLAFELGDGSEIWSPMARGVIGGMILSTALTLVVVPALYVAIARRVDRRRARKRARLEAGDAPEAIVARAG